MVTRRAKSMAPTKNESTRGRRGLEVKCAPGDQGVCGSNPVYSQSSSFSLGTEEFDCESMYERPKSRKCIEYELNQKRGRWLNSNQDQVEIHLIQYLVDM